ncbi:hypothetical protein CRI77_23835 [Mycolicibacterium duvalii]|nr:hypothetical protein CRI77_23835 [Mycolicibacterium duvalii]
MRSSTDDTSLRKGTASPILDAGQMVIAGMRLTAGWGRPEQGELFERAAYDFDSAAGTLATARPNEDWEGAAAQSYAYAHHRQAARVDAIALLDRHASRVLSRQAQQVEVRRDNLDEQSDFLADVSRTTWALASVPGFGPAAKTTVELAAVATAVHHSGQELALLSRESSHNAGELIRLASHYTALAVPEGPPALDGDPLPDEEPADEVPKESEDSRSDSASDDVVGPGVVAPVPAAGRSTRADTDNSLMSAPVLSPPPVPAAVPVGSTASGGPPAAPATDPMSGMASAFGALGGLIGAMVAPLTATVAGAAGAVGQSLSTLTAGGTEIPDADEGIRDHDAVGDADRHPNGESGSGEDADTRAPRASDAFGGASPAPEETEAEVAIPPARPADTVPSVPAPPAATRPPQ